MTGSRSLYGADAAKARYDRICEACVTPEEQAEILKVQAASVKIKVALDLDDLEVIAEARRCVEAVYTKGGLTGEERSQNGCGSTWLCP